MSPTLHAASQHLQPTSDIHMEAAVAGHMYRQWLRRHLSLWRVSHIWCHVLRPVPGWIGHLHGYIR